MHYSIIDGTRDDHTKWSKPDKDKYHMISLICGIWFFKWYKWTYLQNRNRLPDFKKKNYGYQRGNMAGTDKLGAWD